MFGIMLSWICLVIISVSIAVIVGIYFKPNIEEDEDRKYRIAEIIDEGEKYFVLEEFITNIWKRKKFRVIEYDGIRSGIVYHQCLLFKSKSNLKFLYKEMVEEPKQDIVYKGNILQCGYVMGTHKLLWINISNRINIGDRYPIGTLEQLQEDIDFKENKKINKIIAYHDL